MNTKKIAIALSIIIIAILAVNLATKPDKGPDNTLTNDTDQTLTELDVKAEDDKPLDSERELLVKTDDNELIFERDNKTGKYYINSNEIDFNYKFENNISNSEGSINTYMTLIAGDNFTIHDDWFGFVDFTTDFFGSKSTNKVLVVTLEGVHSAKVDRYASGAYSDSEHYTLYDARLIIDPQTASVIDMISPNYYYDYGSQRYSTKNNYTNVYE